MTVLIKRYANRKLYNTEASRYITLKGISELIENGDDVRVIDNESGEDITHVTLSQILVDSEREGRQVPKSILTDLLHRGGDALYDVFRRGVGDAGGLDDLRDGVRRIVKAGERERDRFQDMMTPPDIEHVVQNAVERVFKLLDLPRRGDIEALNDNLHRVAEAVERLERSRREAAGDASEPGED
jgi:polyhydroxyalkanoate synthesis repressor PhaR